MPEIIVRAHAAPIDPSRFLENVGTGAHVEYLAQVLVAGLFVAKAHREDTVVSLVLEKSTDYSRTLRFDGSRIGDLGGLNESALLELMAATLDEAGSIGKEEIRVTAAGVEVIGISFEHLVRARLASAPVFLLDRKGDDIRDVALSTDSVFVLTDHVPMPRKVRKSFIRQGARPVSLGPLMLQASQCVVLVQNEIDRRSAH